MHLKRLICQVASVHMARAPKHIPIALCETIVTPEHQQWSYYGYDIFHKVCTLFIFAFTTFCYYPNLDSSGSFTHIQESFCVCTPGGEGGEDSVRKLLGVCRGPLKIGPKKIEGKMVFWGQKDRILWGFVPKRSFLCWWMTKNTPKRSSLVPGGSKKGVKTAAHMYHPSYREYPPRDAPNQWEMALHCSVISHWLGTSTK